MIKKDSKNKGQVMLLSALLIGGSILAATSVAGYLMLLQIRQSTNIANSAKAITAASSGVDWALYMTRKNTEVPNIVFENNAGVNVNINGNIITSVGRSGDSYRALEINMAYSDIIPPIEEE